MIINTAVRSHYPRQQGGRLVTEKQVQSRSTWAPLLVRFGSTGAFCTGAVS
jgi:hypothetical protein